MKIGNKKEFEKQYRDYIVNSNSYLESNILIGHNEEVPISSIQGENITTEDVARMIFTLLMQAKDLQERYPETEEIMKNMQVINIKDELNKMIGDESNGN